MDNRDSSEQNGLFETVQRESTLVGRVTRQIEDLILEGRLRQGDLLPPERELARQFGVSRTVVREAVRGLVAKSLLDVRAGSGTVVSSPTVKPVAQSMTMLLRAGTSEFDHGKVLEVRRLLEVEIARLAAERRTTEDLERMEEILRDAEKAQDRDAFAECDVDFHAALAQATHNDLFCVLLDSISDIMIKVRQMGFDVPGTPARALRYHRSIFDRVKAGDPEGARQAMREHLVEAEETIREALALSTHDTTKS